jgi:glycosyltransferase involved in cell wall biosynthesis
MYNSSMSLTHPKISVVVCAYNEEKYLRDCLVSIKKQVVDVPFEIIVVDNASTDETAAIAKDEGVILVSQPEKGVGHARAKGLEVARGEILVYLDADTRLPSGWLQNVENYFKKHPKVAAITTDFRFYDGKLPEVIGQRLFNTLLMPVNNFVMSLVNKPEVLIGQSTALRTDWLRKAGGINLDFAFHGEDTSLAYRMHSQGKVKFVKDFYVYSSARRYQREGLIKTLFAYWTTYWIFTLGGYDKAVKFAQQHNPKHLKSAS